MQAVRSGARRRTRWERSALLLAAALLVGCQSTQHPPLPLAEDVDLQAFMGDWYVIGGILTSFEDGAHNAVETYELREGGRVATTFRFRRDSFDGEVVVWEPTGFVREGTGNAVWGMQFFWPVRLDYRIVRHDEQAGIAVIGRQKRDLVWIMAREPELPEARWEAIVADLAAIGYDADVMRRVPQRWPE